MSKFRVSVHGKHCEIGVLKKRIFRKSYSTRAVGFYATRFVQADTANDAITTAFALLRSELEDEGRLTPESIMELEEVREDEQGFDLYAPGAGYTFYAETGEKDDNSSSE